MTNYLTAGIALKGQAIDTSGLPIDGYISGDEDYSLRASGLALILIFVCHYYFTQKSKDKKNPDCIRGNV